MKFEGEVNRRGEALCGEDFMAGTICSLYEGHSGPHGSGCTICGGDWYHETCSCIERCEFCDDWTEVDETDCRNCEQPKERSEASAITPTVVADLFNITITEAEQALGKGSTT